MLSSRTWTQAELSRFRGCETALLHCPTALHTHQLGMPGNKDVTCSHSVYPVVQRFESLTAGCAGP